MTKYLSSPTNKEWEVLVNRNCEILACGHSYIITGPNRRVYRRNRAHLKPICYDSSSFQNCTTAEKDEKPKVDSFQDPKKDKKKVKTVSFSDTTDIMARAMIFDVQNDNHPSHPSSLLAQITFVFTPIICRIQGKFSGTQYRGSHT